MEDRYIVLCTVTLIKKTRQNTKKQTNKQNYTSENRETHQLFFWPASVAFRRVTTRETHQILFPSNAFMASVRSLHTFNRDTISQIRTFPHFSAWLISQLAVLFLLFAPLFPLGNASLAGGFAGRRFWFWLLFLFLLLQSICRFQGLFVLAFAFHAHSHVRTEPQRDIGHTRKKAHFTACRDYAAVQCAKVCDSQDDTSETFRRTSQRLQFLRGDLAQCWLSDRCCLRKTAVRKISARLRSWFV